MKLQLMTYDLSGSDSTKWYNKWLRRLGQPPVLYDHSLTATSANQLRLALLNRGYMDAKVTVDTMRHDRKKKIDVVYNVVPGRPTSSSVARLRDPRQRDLSYRNGRS